MRPLLIGNESNQTRQGGLNRYLAELVGALVNAGASPRAIVVGQADGDLICGVSDPEAPLLARLKAVRENARRLMVETDLVDAHFALYALLPIMTTAVRRAPLVVHFQGPWADESQVGRGQGRMVGMVKRSVERCVYRRAQLVVVLSEAFGRLLVERYGVDPARVEVVPPGVDLDRFRPGRRDSARARFDLPPDHFVVVSVRRLDARMGLDVLLDAWATVQAIRPDATLLVAGDGRERADLERRRRRLPLPDQVRFVGSVTDDELVSLYQAADCSVVPTRALEGFGLVTLESAACGTPAVVTEVGGLPDGVNGLDATLVVPADDPGALAGRLLAAADGDLPGRAATRTHAEKFSWDRVAARHLELYERARGPRPLRVDYIGHTAQLSGGELALARLLPSLTRIEPRVLLAEDGPLVARLHEDGVPVKIVPMGSATRNLRRDRVSVGRLPLASVLGAVAATWRLTRHLRADRPDLVHTNTLKAALYGGVAGRLAGVPVVWHLRDRIADDYLPMPAVRLVRIASRILPAAVIGNSEATLATLGRRGAHTRIYDVVVPSPVSAPPGDRPSAAAQHPFTVGLVGRLAPWKGQDVFLRAFALAFPYGDARARVVGTAMFGEDTWADALLVLASELGIGGRVDFLGFAHDVGAEYLRFDVLVHASVIPEPFGQVVFEAMAYGVPVVAPASGGPGEIITDGVDGVLYPMGDIEALAAQLRRLAGAPELRAHLAEAGRHRVVEFTPDKVATQVMDVYARVQERPWSEGGGRRIASFLRTHVEAAACRAVRSTPRWAALDARAHYWAGRFLSRYPGKTRRRVVTIGEEARLIVNLDDPDGLRTYISASYEADVVAFARAVVQQGDTVVDVGANIGAHSLLFGELVGADGHVHAFEPGECPASQLRASIALNDWESRFTVHQMALSQECGSAMLRLSGATGGTSSLIGLPWLIDATPVEIQTTTLDSLVENIGRSRLMKIDVEGAEQLVLAGGRLRFFAEVPPDYLIVEFWSYGDPGVLYQALLELGYVLAPASPGLPCSAGRSTLELFQDGFEYRNLFFERTPKVSTVYI